MKKQHLSISLGKNVTFKQKARSPCSSQSTCSHCSSVVALAMPQVSSRPLQIYISVEHGGGNITTITLPDCSLTNMMYFIDMTCL